MAFNRCSPLLPFLIGLSLGTLATGCGDDAPDRPPQPDAQFVDAGPDLGPTDGGAPGADAGAPTACADPDGPTVAILTPAPATDPVADEVVVGPFGDVSCRVTRGTSAEALAVDTESITIEVLDEGGSVLATPAVTAEGDVFTAQPNLGSLPNGAIAFRCSATDTAEMPRCASAEVATFLDNGPAIEVLSPATGSIHASQLTLRYRVSPDPLADGDTEAAVAGHTLVVAGASHTPTMEGDTLVATIDFEDRAVYPEPLSGPYELAIEATNVRTPEAAVRTYRQSFTVDTEGPQITITEPGSGELVGGTVLVEATITDAAGVDPSTVVLRAAGMDFPMSRVTDSDSYRVTFDASIFPTTVVELTLNLTAEDVVGNARTVSRGVKLDAVGPILSLDPPAVREARMQSGALQCSVLFDPLGDDSVNDGQVQGTTPELRVRAHDLSNESFGGSGTVIFFAGIDSVDVLVLDDTSRALLVDQDGDGVCDAINPAVEPNPADSSSAVLIQMEAITSRGTAFYSDSIDPTTPGDPAEAYAGVFGDCVAGAATMAPSPVCAATSPLTRVIDRPFPGVPAIYGKPVVTADICVGDSWDFVGAGVSEGWVCVAARGIDALGNEGVSPPLRMCLTDGVGTDPCGGAIGDTIAEAMRPSCTDGCSMPQSFADIPGLQQIGPAP